MCKDKGGSGGIIINVSLIVGVFNFLIFYKIVILIKYLFFREYIIIMKINLLKILMWVIFFLYRVSFIIIYIYLLCYKKWCFILYKGSSSKIFFIYNIIYFNF